MEKYLTAIEKECGFVEIVCVILSLCMFERNILVGVNDVCIVSER